MNEMERPTATDGKEFVERSHDVAGEKEGQGGILTALEHGLEEVTTQPPAVVLTDVVKLELPYILMLAMAVLGIGVIIFTGEPTFLYWEIVTPIYCAICINLGWRHAETHEKRVELIWTQILHWFAVLVAMWIVHSDLVRGVVDNNATGLNLMTILALATFLAGVHAKAWQISSVGVALALCVPAMAFIHRSAFLFTMLAVAGVLLAGVMIGVSTYIQKRNVAQPA